MNLIPPRLRAQIVKELLSILRDPRARFILIGPPLIQLLVFSFAATLEVSNATLAVYDRDGGRWAQELVASLGAASFVGTLRQVNSRQALHAAIERREAILALEIHDTFSRQMTSGGPAALQAIVDGRRANSGQVALGYVEEVAANLGAAFTPAARQPPVRINIRHAYNPNLIYQWFVVPSLAGILVMVVSLTVTALSIARERELGTFDQLLVSPTTSTEIILAKTVPALLIGGTLGLLMVAAGIAGFRVPFQGSLLALAAAMLLFILSIVGVGLMISAISATQQQAILGAFAVVVPMILMSGFATPVENMPQCCNGWRKASPSSTSSSSCRAPSSRACPPGRSGAMPGPSSSSPWSPWGWPPCWCAVGWNDRVFPGLQP
jgi:ABC-2 type transport system permease protein